MSRLRKSVFGSDLRSSAFICGELLLGLGLFPLAPGCPVSDNLHAASLRTRADPRLPESSSRGSHPMPSRLFAALFASSLLAAPAFAVEPTLPKPSDVKSLCIYPAKLALKGADD